MSIHSVPPEGLDHPVFAGMDARDEVITILQFRDVADEETLERCWTGIQKWADSVERDKPKAVVFSEEPWFSSRSIRVRLCNLKDPRAAARALVERVQSAIALKEVYFSRWHQPEGTQTWEPAQHPEAPAERRGFTNPEEYMEAVFQLDEPAPASEYVAYLKGAFESADGELALEERGMPLYLPGVRICYGLAGAPFTPPDGRTVEIAEALVGAVDSGFADIYFPPGNDEWRPYPFDHQGGSHMIDRLDYLGRTGYAFAISSEQLIHMYTATQYRYREPEVMRVLARVIEEKKLAPIICWQRFAKPLVGPLAQPSNHVFQLWEPIRSR